MPAANSTASTVELPSGCKHFRTSAFAESWEAYDRLAPGDGWREVTRFDPETGAPRSWKEGEVRGHTITVHAPNMERGDA